MELCPFKSGNLCLDLWGSLQAWICACEFLKKWNFLTLTCIRLHWLIHPHSKGTEWPKEVWRERMNSIHSVLLFLFWIVVKSIWGFPDGSDGKESACNAGDPGLISGSGRSPGEGNENPFHSQSNPSILVLPGKFHGQGSLADYSPWGHKQSDSTEWLTMCD